MTHSRLSEAWVFGGREAGRRLSLYYVATPVDFDGQGNLSCPLALVYGNWEVYMVTACKIIENTGRTPECTLLFRLLLFFRNLWFYFFRRNIYFLSSGLLGHFLIVNEILFIQHATFNKLFLDHVLVLLRVNINRLVSKIFNNIDEV